MEKISLKVDERQHKTEKWIDTESRLVSVAPAVPSADKILDALTNTQVYPSSDCVELNDKLVKTLFAGKRNFISGKTYGIIEKKRHKFGKGKNKTIAQLISNYSVGTAEGYDTTEPLNEFTRDVLSACIAEYLAGNEYTTVNIIFRHLIGKVGEVGIVPRANQKSAIVDAVIRLMATIVDFRDFNNSLAEMHYTDNKGNSLNLGAAPLLSAVIVDAKINGQPLEDVIFFNAISPLFEIADAKNQIVRYPAFLLDVPNQNNTPRIIALKKYVMRRICEIKLHPKQLAPTITFHDVFQKCGLSDADRFKKEDARNAVIKFLDHLQAQDFIKSCEIIKHGKLIHAVKFSF